MNLLPPTPMKNNLLVPTLIGSGSLQLMKFSISLDLRMRNAAAAISYVPGQNLKLETYSELVEIYRNYHGFLSASRNTAGSFNFNPKGPCFSSRYYYSGKNTSTDEWTEEVEYLDETGISFTPEGIRSVEPGLDDHVMVGGLKKPILNASAVAKLVEIVKRWRWGLDMETQLDKLHLYQI
ncbi:hypothetical protein HAX54_051196 [Datura stramonium]|uniref:Uncharacterized protein n=1 Tax=Datura stramonium TaxID=4076 RepID=A0ABS8WR03_DATST|nr:hypothetical protein [Datura stramonium]